MFSLANQVLDAYDDIERKDLMKLASLRPETQMRSEDEKSSLTDHDFALCILTKNAGKLNKFPVKSFDDTWLSCGYFQKNAHKLPEQARGIAAWHLKEACERHGLQVPKTIEKTASKAEDNVFIEGEGLKAVSAPVKTASMSEMAEAEKIATNYTFAQYAFSSPSHVKMGSKYFEKFASKMPLEIRHGYAESLQKRANELGLPPLEGAVGKYASDHYNAMVDAHLRSRASLLEAADPKFDGVLKKMAGMRSNTTPQEFAKALHRFDKAAGLTKYYDGYLTNPYESTFAQQAFNPSCMHKTASGTEVAAENLRETAEKRLDKIKEYFGESVAREFKTDPSTVFDSLPNDAKEIIAGISNGTL